MIAANKAIRNEEYENPSLLFMAKNFFLRIFIPFPVIQMISKIERDRDDSFDANKFYEDNKILLGRKDIVIEGNEDKEFTKLIASIENVCSLSKNALQKVYTHCTRTVRGKLRILYNYYNRNTSGHLIAVNKAVRDKEYDNPLLAHLAGDSDLRTFLPPDILSKVPGADSSGGGETGDESFEGGLLDNRERRSKEIPN